ncbi:caspase-1-like isoform X3 [Labrus mixtus]|uniref:caspase-1-like isoform X3 n=1 Tax=Labrus mixtus TaxID=508554 RepID=UPI0029C003B3|nr:caspase-1-like isoform X3 [Labrus mixtus]
MADKELARVRTKFVDKVSKEVINQLLDDILEDGILNDGEKDSLLELNVSKADKARCLIDTVKRKGDAASRKMITHLQRRDATLFSEVGLSCGPPAQPAEPKQEQEWSTSLIPSTQAFWREKQNDTSIYKVTNDSIKSRVALLITNIKFTNEKLNRNGAVKDEENMEKLLICLGYEVVKRTNLTGKQINDAVIEFSKHPKLKGTDSVLVVIMSHGKLGAVLGVDWKDEPAGDVFPIDNIYEHLGSEKCPVLLNKPKIIIIQACRGEEKGSVLVRDAASSALMCDDLSSLVADNIEEDNLRYVHKEKDLISFLSCTHDTVSYRDPVRGSILIQYLIAVLNTFAHKDDIEELFRKVMERFEEFAIQAKMQMPTKERCNLTKRFYFFPGI